MRNAGNQLIVLAGTAESAAPPPLLHPPQHGLIRLAPNGYTFHDENGQDWRWQGATLARLFGRYIDGENIDAEFRWMRNVGINVARVWPQWGGKPGTSTDILHRLDELLPKLRALVDLGAEWGVRFEMTAITDWTTPDNDRPLLQGIYDVCEGAWNVFVEGVNEPWNTGYDCKRLYSGVNRRGLLSAYGYQPFDDHGHWAIEGKLDFVTCHLPRDDAHYPRNSKDLYEQRQAMMMINGDDEPLGIAEFTKPAPGQRSNDPVAHFSHFSGNCQFGAISTIHTHYGLDGKAPTPENEPITSYISAGIGVIWNFIPPHAIEGRYSRNGFSDFPLWVEGDDVYDGQGHAYAVLFDDVGWACVPYPKDPTRVFPTANGWQIAEVCPVAPYIVKVTR